MNCKRCKHKLISYLEGTLEGFESKEMEHHLEECASCRGFAEYLSETLAIFEGMRVTEPDPYFFTRVKARTDQQENTHSVNSGWVRILQPAIFSLLLILAIYTGIQIGNLEASVQSESYAMENLDPWMNELGSEPLETFLMN